MTLRKLEDTVNWNRKHQIAQHRELALREAMDLSQVRLQNGWMNNARPCPLSDLCLAQLAWRAVHWQREPQLSPHTHTVHDMDSVPCRTEREDSAYMQSAFGCWCEVDHQWIVGVRHVKFRVTIDCTPNHINRMKYGCVNSNLRKVKKKNSSGATALQGLGRRVWNCAGIGV